MRLKLFIISLFAFPLLTFFFPIYASATTVTATSTTQSQSAGNQQWSNLANVEYQDTTYATASVNDGAVYASVLYATGFGFAIPTGATINSVNFNYYSYSTENLVKQRSCSVLVDGVEVYNNCSGLPNSPTSNTLQNFATTTDLTPEIINDVDFGFAYSVFCSGCSGTDTAYLDYVEIVVDYSLTPSATLTIEPASPQLINDGSTLASVTDANFEYILIYFDSTGAKITNGEIDTQLDINLYGYYGTPSEMISGIYNIGVCNNEIVDCTATMTFDEFLVSDGFYTSQEYEWTTPVDTILTYGDTLLIVQVFLTLLGVGLGYGLVFRA